MSVNIMAHMELKGNDGKWYAVKNIPTLIDDKPNTEKVEELAYVWCDSFVDVDELISSGIQYIPDNASPEIKEIFNEANDYAKKGYFYHTLYDAMDILKDKEYNHRMDIQEDIDHIYGLAIQATNHSILNTDDIRIIFNIF